LENSFGILDIGFDNADGIDTGGEVIELIIQVIKAEATAALGLFFFDNGNGPAAEDEVCLDIPRAAIKSGVDMFQGQPADAVVIILDTIFGERIGSIARLFVANARFAVGVFD